MPDAGDAAGEHGGGNRFRPLALIASWMPGTRATITSSVASGVTSRGPRPVPPVVMIASRPSLSHQYFKMEAMSACSSATVSRMIFTPGKNSSMTVSTAAPPVSSISPLETRSLTVSMPTLMAYSSGSE